MEAKEIRTCSLRSAADSRLVANATGAEPGGVLFVKALSTPDGTALTYVAMFRHNVDA